MPISVGEYLGQRTDAAKEIEPVKNGASYKCPFMEAKCSKTPRYHPVCSVRDTKGTPWIVCSHRLCSTRKNIPLNKYQQNRLLEVAQAVFGDDIESNEVLVKREVPMQTGSGTSYSADYIMSINRISGKNTRSGPSKVVLEMQGGGETSNTGDLTRHIDVWKNEGGKNNELLSKPIDKVGAIVTNAWRRQQEQFLVKGNIAIQTGAGIVFCVGVLLFDVIHKKIKDSGLRNLQEHNWTLALVCFSEDTTDKKGDGALPIKVNKDKLLFTNYHSFVRALMDQGSPDPLIFSGIFENLSGEKIQVD